LPAFKAPVDLSDLFQTANYVERILAFLHYNFGSVKNTLPENCNLDMWTKEPTSCCLWH